MSAPTHIVQSFYEQGRRLMADQARKMKSTDEAVAGAKRLAERKAGVVAYSIVYEAESDVTGDPVILFRAGKLPPELSGT